MSLHMIDFVYAQQFYKNCFPTVLIMKLKNKFFIKNIQLYPPPDDNVALFETFRKILKSMAAELKEVHFAQ